MELYESIRARQADIIAQNPASIVITRTTRTRNSIQGFDEATTTLTAQTVRIYAKLRYTKIVNVNEAGWTVRKTQRMIAKYNADLKAESEGFLDKFSYNSKTYKIVDVQDILTQNYVVFRQCEIEEIA
jgi:hypothetical protein